ncbi:MAG: glycoside hydrolase family 130 protein [Tepidisphaeraceae bacterium]
MKLKRFEDRPILSPDPKSPWQSLVTTNPGAWYDAERGEVIMLYRAAGDDDEHKVYLGLATSRDGYHFTRQSDQPVLSPSELGFDGGCVEDPRIIRIGEWYYVTYASRPFPPGKYWLDEGRHYVPPECPADFPWHLRKNATTTYLGLTRDFKTWYRAGRLTNPKVDDRDVYFFPEKIHGKYWMIHRPMNWTGPEYGTEYPAMWISSGTDMLACNEAKLLAKAELPWENKKIGGNTPPLRTASGWLTLYHAVGTDKKYRLGAMLLDLEDPTKVTHRTRDWILQPEKDFELEGFYPGVVFPCGKVIIGDTLFVYYGGADKHVGLATCKINDLLDYLLACPSK